MRDDQRRNVEGFPVSRTFYVRPFGVISARRTFELTAGGLRGASLAFSLDEPCLARDLPLPILHECASPSRLPALHVLRNEQEVSQKFLAKQQTIHIICL